MRIQTRIILTIVSFQLVLLISFGMIIYHFTKNYINTDFEKELIHRANINEKVLLEQDYISIKEYKNALKEYSEKLENEKIYHIKYSLINDSIISHSSPIFPKQFVTTLLQNKSSFYSDNSLNFYGKEYVVNNEKWIIIISAEDPEGLNLLNSLRRIIIIGTFVISIIILLVSYFLSRSLLDPIKRKIKSAMKISSSNLHERINIENPNDEIGQLAIAFNRMLDRLEESFKLQSSFISNASHEIKNPLTTISGTAEIALLKDRSIPEYKKTLESILQDSDFLNSLVNQLFNLAKTDANYEKLPKDIFHLTDILDTIHNQNNRSNPNKVKIIISNNTHSTLLYGNKDLLKSAIQNLIDNALKFSNGKDVVIETIKKDNNISIVITDNGPGVEEHELQKITSAFYRSEKVRDIKGHGIGLTLTQKIIELHNGKLFFKNKRISSGLSVEISLPLSS